MFSIISLIYNLEFPRPYSYCKDYLGSIYLKWHCKMISCRAYSVAEVVLKTILKNNAKINGSSFFP